MWNRLIENLLGGLFKHGTLEVHLPDGSAMRFGDGTGDPVKVRLHEPDLIRKIVMRPELAVGEAYMDGSLTIDDDDLYGFFELAITNINQNGGPWWKRAIERIRDTGFVKAFRQFNPRGRAQKNVAHHYDLGDVYELFLDEDKQYSCAYFTDPEMTLDDAQSAKKHHIAKKLRIEPGMRVLDIGCGWGGMAMTLARDYGAHVVGVTLSEDQHRIANERVAAAGLSDRVDIRLSDYRNVAESFDRIVSVGMFEHVGVPHYKEYFRTVHDMLTPDGIALIHTIGHTGVPNDADPWTVKYIFPGGYAPAMSEVVRAIEKFPLVISDIEILRVHYADTLDHWFQRFMEKKDVAQEMYDERFVRMWKYYLVSMSASFRHGVMLVHQYQLAKRNNIVPITRDYIYADDAVSDVQDTRFKHVAE